MAAGDSTASSWSYSTLSMVGVDDRPLPLLLAAGSADSEQAISAATKLRSVLSSESARELTAEQVASALNERATALTQALRHAEGGHTPHLSWV